MEGHIIFSILFYLFLAQTAFSKPIDVSSEESSEEVEAVLKKLQTNGTESEKLILSRKGNYLLIPQKFTYNAYNATKHMLQDEALKINKNSEILEFKKNFILFLDKYDPAANLQETHKTMEFFRNITAHYFELSEEKMTPESKFIIDLLNKYQIKDVAIDLNELEAFVDKWRITGSASEKLVIFTLDSLITIPQQCAANATNATQYLLKDASLNGNLKPEIEEFKNKLNLYLENYDPTSSNIISIYFSMEVFHNIIESYYLLPPKQVTEDKKLIIDLLNKYNCNNYSITLIDHIVNFTEEFKRRFEDFKNDLKEPLLVWYDKFIKLTTFPEKMTAIDELINLAQENRK
ncbi:hypothetical protein FF38_12670 [Lucilia cuprina]|uniref:Protein G12 n=1 Tax=Lucilia cuprina TaxID=7375 RepID=A0A0L0C4A4_LUCCU|nr:hypothetical protein CVS40_7844 [Lucilia cuprina]KNC27120.1 hypothetical protein FF38_12670 [Lucilia cuprina]